MAAAITTTATTLEGQLLEVAQALQAGELAIPEESRPNNIQIGIDTEVGQVSITSVIPVTFNYSNGGFHATPQPYLT